MIDTFPWLDGFDYYATDRLTYKWASASEVHVAPGGGRRGSGCIVPTGAASLVSRDLDHAAADCWLCFALKRQAMDAFSVFAQSAGNVNVFEFQVTCSGRIGYREAGGTFAYSEGIIPACEWCWLGLRVGDDGIRLLAYGPHGRRLMNETLTLTTGFDSGTGAIVSAWRLEAAVCGHWLIDDLYIQTGADCPGDCRIDLVEMDRDADNSEYDEWTLSTGSTFAGVLNQRPDYADAIGITAAFGCLGNAMPHRPSSIAAMQLNVWVKYTFDETYIAPGYGFYLNISSNASNYLRATDNELENGIAWSIAQNLGQPIDPWLASNATFSLRMDD